MKREQNIKNLKTEKDGIKLLRSLIKGFDVPSKEQLKIIYSILNINYKKYSRSVDGMILNVSSFEEIRTKEDFTLVEIKTTSSSSVKELPHIVKVTGFAFTPIEKFRPSKQVNELLKICGQTIVKYHIKKMTEQDVE